MSDATRQAVLAASGFGLTWLAQSSALLILGLAAGRAARGRGPALQSAVYRTTLAAVLLAPLASAAFAALGLPGLAIRLADAEAAPEAPEVAPLDRSAPPVAESVEPAREAFASPEPASPFDEDASTAFTPAPPTEFEPRPAPEPEPAKAAVEPPPAPIEPRDETVARTAAACLAAWAFGTLALLARLAVREARMRGLRATAVDAGPEARAACEEIARRMGVSPPPVRRSPFLPSPCLDGLARPTILLPEDADDPRDALVHELAHLARRDGWWNLARRLAGAALWPQPLLRPLSRRLESSAEEVCDDVVVSFGADRARYAELLVELAGRALPPPSAAVVCMVALRSLLARRIARILDASRPLSTRANRRAVAAVLAAGLLATASAGLLNAGRPALADDEPEAPASATDAPPDDGRIRGRVVGPDGRPVAGATVLVTATRQGADDVQTPGQWAGVSFEKRRGVTDADGRYDLEGFATPPADPEYPMAVIAVADGFAPGADDGEGLVRLGEPGPPFEGRVVDAEGRPAPGARVVLEELYFLPSGAPADPSQPWDMKGRKSLDLSAPVRSEARTDDDGRFRFDGVGKDTILLLAIDGPDVALRHVMAVNRAIDRTKLPNRHSFQSVGLGSREFDEVSGSPCTIEVAPSSPVEGVVRDIDTGEPIAGVVIASHDLGPWPGPIDERRVARTDGQGRFRFTGLPKAGADRRLTAYPPDDRPYFVANYLILPDAPEAGPTTFDIALKRGTWIEGRVVDRADGKPVSARVDYSPMQGNPRIEDYTTGKPDAPFPPRMHYDRFRTDDQGRFRVLGMPGPGVVLVLADRLGYRSGLGAEALDHDPRGQLLATPHLINPGSFHAMKVIDAAAGESASVGDVELAPGGSVVLNFVDEAGKPTPARPVIGRLPAFLNAAGPSTARPTLRILGLDPGERRAVFVQSAQRGLGAVVTVADGDPDRRIVLRPPVAITGRLRHADGRIPRGKVIAGIAEGDDRPRLLMSFFDSEIDDQGRFRVMAYPNAVYRIHSMNATPEQPGGGKGHSSQKVPGGFQGFDLASELKVEGPGPIDLGTFDVDSGKKVEDVAEAVEPIRGRVVGPDGQPVAGASVFVRSIRAPREGGESTAVESVERRGTTDADGRYDLEGFASPPRYPEQPMRVVAVADGFSPGADDGAGLVRLGDPGPPFEGRVVDAEGHPVSGARVVVADYYFLPAGTPADPSGPWTMKGRMSLYGLLPEVSEARTDADGRFRFEGVGRDALLTLAIDGPDVASRRALVVNRAIGRTRLPEQKVSFLPGVGMQLFDEMQGSPSTIEVAPSSPVEGVVRDADTGEPIAGVVIDSFDTRRSPGPIDERRAARTDAQGRYRFTGLPKAGADRRLAAYPPDDRPYFAAYDLTPPDAPEAGSTTFDIALKRGTWIEGRVVDRADGKPVAARVDYRPMQGNPRIEDYTGRPDAPFPTGMRYDRFRTDDQGRFRILGIPGPGVVLVLADDLGYRTGIGADAIDRAAGGVFIATSQTINPGSAHAMKPVDATAEGPASVGDLELVRGGSVLLNFVDEAGRPKLVGSGDGRLPRFINDPQAQRRVGSSMQVLALAPGERRLVSVKTLEGGQGAVVTVVDGDPDRTVVVHPSVEITGRLRHSDGRIPQGEVFLRFATVLDPQRPTTLSTSEIDGQGRFRATAFPGAAYRIFTTNLSEVQPHGGKSFSPEKVPGGYQGFDLASELKIDGPGPIDLGTFDVDSGKKVEEVADAEAATPGRTLRGRVQAESGGPIAGAVVVAWREGEVDGPTPRAGREAARTTTDAEGRFELPADALRGGGTLVVKAGGFRTLGVFPDVSDPRWSGEGATLAMRPAEAEAIEGRLVDPDGAAVASARVELLRVERREGPPAGDVPFSIAPLPGRPIQPQAATTDADGRFLIEGLDRSDRAALRISGPTIADKLTRVIARPGDPIELDPGGESRVPLDDGVLWGSRCTIPVVPTRPVEGQVRDAETGEPIPGAIVAARVISGEPMGREDLLSTVADAEGRYRLVGLPKDQGTGRTPPLASRLLGLPAVQGTGHKLAVYPPLDRPYFPVRDLDVPRTAGEGPAKLDAELRRGVWIEGKVTDRADGRPIDALVDYFPIHSNPHAEGHPAFRPGFVGPPSKGRYRTDAEGRYRIPGLPGAGVVATLGRGADAGYRMGVLAGDVEKSSDGASLQTRPGLFPGLYHSLKRVDVPDGEQGARCDLELDPGRTVVLKVQDEAGAPVAGARVDGSLPHLAGPDSVDADAKGEVRIRGLSADEVRVIRIRDASGGRGALVPLDVVATPEAATPAVTLRPLAAIAGRIVDGQGRAVPGEVRVSYPASVDGRPYRASVASGRLDAEGRFRLEGLPEADRYQVSANALNPARDPDRYWGFALAESLRVAAGRSVDLGTFHFETGRRVDAPEGAEPEPIRGRVVSPDGRPVAGATVIAWRQRWGRPEAVGLSFDGDESRIGPGLGTTDAEGRYEIPGVPDLPEVVEGPDGRHRRPSQARVLAVAEGFGAAEEIQGEIRLSRAGPPIQGRVVDAQGRPVAGARVRIVSASLLPRGVKAPDDPWGQANRRSLAGGVLERAIAPKGLVADAEGKFRIEGLGEGDQAVVEVSHPDVAKTRFLVLVRDMPATPAPRRPMGAAGGGAMTMERPAGLGMPFLGGEVIHGATCTLEVEPGVVVEGVVRDAKSGAPIEGLVVAIAPLRSMGTITDRFSAVTDREGRCRIEGVPILQGRTPWMSFHPRPDQPYFAKSQVDIPAPVANRSKFEAVMHPGVWLEGRVVEEPGDKPVAASVDYIPDRSNREAELYLGPILNAGGIVRGGVHDGRFRTDAAGAFRVLAAPGRGIVAARTDDLTYLIGRGAEEVRKAEGFEGLPQRFALAWASHQGLTAVQVPEAGPAPACRVVVGRGASVLLKFVDPDGNPTRAYIPLGRHPYQTGQRRPERPSEAGTEARVVGLGEDEVRPITVTGVDQAGGAKLTVSAGDGERTVVVGPRVEVTGRFVDAKGSPIRGQVELIFANENRGFATPPFPNLFEPLDSFGGFRVQMLPGGPYHLWARRGGNMTRQGGGRLGEPVAIPGDVHFEAGKPISLGVINVDAPKPIGAKPDAPK